MTVSEKVIKIITDELRLQDGVVQPALLLKDDLDMQSLDSIELLMALEDAFKIEFKNYEHKTIETVQDVIDAVNKLVK